jgi:hypothetical protein
MSWGFEFVGKASAVRTKCAAEFAKNPCSEPEETVRQSAAKAVDEALAAQDSTVAVKVTARGSQSFQDYTKQTGVCNSLEIKIEPLWGFVE